MCLYRRHIVTILGSALLGAGLMSGCGGGSSANTAARDEQPPVPTTPIATTPAPTLKASNLARELNPAVSADDLASVVNGNTSFALRIMPLLQADPNANTVFSPYSITEAIAMQGPAAQGDTLRGIEQAMAFYLPQQRLNPALNKASLLLAAKAPGTLVNGQALPSLNLSNTLWADQSLQIRQDYLDTLARNFGGGVQQLDFFHNAEAARLSINQFIAGQTKDRIKDLLAQGDVRRDTAMVLTNAIWFKANWSHPFELAQTRPLPFVGHDGVAVSTPFMHATRQAEMTQNAEYQAVNVGYAGQNMVMTLIMPRAGSFDSFLGGLTSDKLAAITATMAGDYVDLSMPKFSFTSSAKLRDALSTLGMGVAFSDAALFPGFTGTPGFKIDNVIHKAFISVDEQGTEAAAATGVTLRTTGIPSVVKVLTFDHPFLFLIRDRETGLVIFMGKVVKL